MATKLQRISELAQQTSQQITGSVDGWKSYLNTAAKLYKYSFDDQLLIHAQRPSATACAFMEQWNSKMGRWVNAGSKGIALIRKGQGSPRLEYVFDVSDTHAVCDGKTPWIWQMHEEHTNPVLASLENLYGTVPQEDVGDKLMEISARAVGEHYREYLHDLNYELDDSFLEGLDDLNVEMRFRGSVTASVQYALLTRCGLDASQYLEDEDFKEIMEFNTPAVVSYLGAATNTVTNEILAEIGRVIKDFEKENVKKPIEKSSGIEYTKNTENFITLNRERSNKNGEHNIHQGGRLSDTGFSDGLDGGRTGATIGQIRNASGNLSDGTPKRQIHLPTDDGQALEAPTGNRQDSPSEGSPNDDRADETKRDNRTTQINRPNGMGATGEQSESTGGGNRAERTSLQLEPQNEAVSQISLFPTVEEQIESIAQATTEEKKSSVFSFSPSSREAVSKEVIDRILTAGSNEQNSTQRIAEKFSRNTSLQENAIFLKEEYTNGGKGFRVDGVPYSLWFSKDSLQIARGQTAKNAYSKVNMTWEQTTERVRNLLETGNYVDPVTLKTATELARKEAAEKLWYLRQNFSDDARNEQFLPTVSDLYGGFPDSTKNIAELLATAAGLAKVTDELQSFCEAYSNDDDLLRFHFHKPDNLLQTLMELQKEPIQFPSFDDFSAEPPVFITQDEIDADLIGGSSFEEGKMRIYAFFMQGQDTKIKAKFLKDEYGTGGYGYTGADQWHDSKGIKLSRGNPVYDTIMQNWGQVVKRIDSLITKKQYMSKQELDYLPTYEKTILAREIYSFYYNQPADTLRPYPSDADYNTGYTAVMGQLDNPEYVQKVQAQMKYILDNTLGSERRFDSMQTTFNDVTAYANGTFSIFAKKAYKEKLAEIDDEEEIDELAMAAKKLERSRSKQFKETDYGQISLDFSRTVPLENALLKHHTQVVDILDESMFTNVSSADKTELNLTPNVTEYLRLKAEYPNQAIGVQVGKLLVFYGKDAQTVAPALGKKIITRDISQLGETKITGDYESNWRDIAEKLLEQGNSFYFAGEVNGGYKLITEQFATDYIPIGMEISIDGRKFSIDSVDYDFNKVSLCDLTFRGGTGFPIFRNESVQFVRSYMEEQAEPAPSLAPLDNKDKFAVNEIGNLQQGLNFHITDDELGVGGAKTKYGFNISAIKTLQNLEAEHRRATPKEQELLSKYVGWGGIPQAFDDSNTSWSAECTELKELLADNEYTSARASTLNAHYTSPTVIKAMYEAVEQMGIPSGNVLEPAMGTGNFFGLLPKSMQKSKLYGVELDSITGRIAKQLYPNADITVKGFEKTDFPDDFFDLAMGNVPFGDYKLVDKRYDKNNLLIHDYFFTKTLDQVRTGGIVAFITSKGTLDKQKNSVRKYLSQKADLLGAIRLPNTAFKANAGTEVTSDIIFLQKRDRIPEREPDWVNLSQTADGIPINSYFVKNPEMILGQMAMVSGQFGQEATCQPFKNSNLSEQLKAAIQNILPPNKDLLQMEVALDDMESTKRNILPADPNVRNFSYTLVNDTLYYRENSRMKPIEVGKIPDARIRGLITLRDCTRKLIDMQLNNGTDEEIKETQAELNTIYEAFSQKNGLINSFGNKQAFEQDASYPLLCSLEVVDEEGKLERKADMFTKRTIKRPVSITSVDTASEALAVSISEKACVDIDFMNSLTGKTEQEIVKELKGVIFINPEHSYENDGRGKYVTSDEYLSGNVREKLELAKRSAKLYPDDYNINVKMLEQIQPKDLSASEIDVRIGATWIDLKYYKQFMYELLQTPKYLQNDKIDIRYTEVTCEWNVKGKSADSSSNARANATYGTKRRNAYTIIDDSLNLRDVRIFDTKIDADGKEKRVLNPKETALAQQKQEAIGEAFKDWIWKDPDRRADLCKTYNTIFNSTRPREYDGQHINFVGMTPELTLRKHQLNAVAHILYGHNTLLAHCVGAGKTFEMIAASMESKRLGLAQKSLFVVPNHLTEQWGGDFLRLYPGANVLVATKKDFEPTNRKKFCARIATGDFDAIIIGHTQFEKIPLSPERQKAILDTQLDEIMTAIADAKSNDGERYTIKQMEKSKKGIESRLTKLTDETRKDNVVTFEELGVDRLFVDEAHGYKNLFLHTKMRNVAGIGQSEAQKSSDMFAKCRYMDELTGGRGITFATGTPVSNSMVELYTMMRYLQFDTLQSQGLGHFDSWAAAFGEKVTAIELAPEGTGFRAKTRFAKFFNLPELMNMWKEAADIQTADMLNLPVPKAEYITVATKPSEYQKEMVLDLADRADAVRKSLVESNVDNMLKITSDGRKLALDQRLKNDLLPDDPDSKINTCVGNIFDVWEETTAVKGAQLVFCDLSTPHYDGSFNVYDDIKNKLMENGIPPNEIAFIHDANTETQKAELFAKVRKGQVRILLGSTAKMGAGTNCQDRLVALHHTDCPWRPSDILQREGRILRQGNLNESVKIYKYVTEGTFDAYNWGLVESKQKFIGQIMTSKNPARSADDVDATALSYAEVKALATGDERIKEKMDLDISVAKLKLLKANHTGQQYEMEDRLIKYFPQEIKKSEERINGLTEDLKLLQAHPIKDDSFSMTISGTLYTERKNAGEALISACKTMENPEEKLIVGDYRGFPMTLFVEESKFKISMKQHLSYTTELASDVSGNITRINNALESITKNLEDNVTRIETLHIEMQGSKEEAARPFPKEVELAEKSTRLNQLNIELDMSGKGDEISEQDERKPAEKPSIKTMLRQFEPLASQSGILQKSRSCEVAM